jgi:hypothetical protein
VCCKAFIRSIAQGYLKENNVTELRDKEDALRPITDELKKKRMWWLLEVFPFVHSWQDAKGVWKRKWRCERLF